TNTWIIQQTTQNAIYEYTSFDIDFGTSVVFMQPDASARFLNYISGEAGATLIDGSLTSNGIVYFVNEAGITFGNNAVVDVGGIYAAAGIIDYDDFLNGIDLFTGLTGKVVNEGHISAAQPGGANIVHLLGAQVRNHGTIDVGPNGVLTMISAEQVQLIPIGGGKISVVMTPSGGEPGQGTGVKNTGTINGGADSQIYLGAADLYALAISNSGTINSEGGTVDLHALAGEIRNTSTGEINAADADVNLHAEDGDVVHKGVLTGRDVQLTGNLIRLGAGLTGQTVTFNGPVRLTDDVQVTGTDSVDFLSTIDGNGNDLSIFADQTTFHGTVFEVGHLYTDAKGSTTIGADITVEDGMEFLDRVFLSNDVMLLDESATGIIFGDRVDGPFSLVIKTGGDAEFHGKVGGSQALARLETMVEGFLLIDTSLIRATGDVIFNEQVNMVGIPVYATIGASGDLRIRAANFAMGQNQKLTVLGDLRIDTPGGSATLGDINTLGDLLVNANKIWLLSRAAGEGIDAKGVRWTDLGLDFVAGGRFYFSVTPHVVGDGLVQFANPNGDGDAWGGLGEFVMRSYGDVRAEEMLNKDGVYLDLMVQGPTSTDVAESFTGAIPEDPQKKDIEQDTPLPPHHIEALIRNLRIRPRVMRPEELEGILTGRVMFLDAPTTVVSRQESGQSVAIGRLTYTLVDDALNRWNELTMDGDRPVEQIRDDLAGAWSGYDQEMGEEPADASDLLAYLRDVGNTEVLLDLQRLDRMLWSVRMIGLTTAEQVLPEDAILNAFLPGETISLEMLKALIEEAGTDVI
ncbi:MAG: filamentous hemagglutinin N-terminal domain-containing protein, partial [Phycisphaerales bacterium]